LKKSLFFRMVRASRVTRGWPEKQKKGARRKYQKKVPGENITATIPKAVPNSPSPSIPD
jgi:hypothetical protein